MPGVEWQGIAGMRDTLAHDYFGVNMDILWDVLTTRLPVPLKQRDAILRDVG